MWRVWLDRAVGIDLRALGLFRICLGLLLLFDLAERAWYLDDHYTDLGILPSQTWWLQRQPWQFSLHALSGETGWVAALFAVAALLAGLLVIGWHTRWVLLASWVLLVSLHHRHTLIIHCGDSLLADLMFWAIFLPLGARWSYDARRLATSTSSAPPQRVVSAASAALLGQMFALYMFSGFMKNGPLWTQGTAITYALQLDVFATALGQRMLVLRDYLPPATIGVLYAERYLPWLLWSPWGHTPLRLLLASVFVGFHLGLILTMHLGIFPYVCILGWIPLLPSAFWDRCEQWCGKPRAMLAAPATMAAPAALQRIGSLATNLFVGAVFIVALYWNAWLTFPAQVRWRPIEPLASAVSCCRLEQNWCMFAPNPAQSDGWFVAAGTLADGSQVDLLYPKRSLTDDKPDLHRDFPYWRWRLYLFFISPPDYRLTYDPFAEWLIQRWNRLHAGSPDQRCRRLELKFWLEPTRLDGNTSWIERRLLTRDVSE